MYLLDTDTLTYFQSGVANVVRRVRDVGERLVGTTVMNRIEILRGRFEFLRKAADRGELLRAQDLLHQSDRFLSKLTIIPFNEASATEFETLRQRKSLKKIGRSDLLIACIVLARRDTLVTRNLKHFRLIPNLKIENWID